MSLAMPEIKCPQPTRPLKRKLYQLDPYDEATFCSQQTAYKRQTLVSPPSDIVNEWLAKLPPFPDRQLSRSDSFLILNMRNVRQKRSTGTSRARSARSAAEKQHAYQPLSPQSLHTVHTSHTPVPLASITPLSLPSLNSRTTVTNSTQDPRKSKRIQSPAYRDELKNHLIYIDSYGMSMPAIIQDFAQEIIGKDRASPDLTDQKLSYIREQLSSLDNADEEVTRTGFASTFLLPKKLDYEVGRNKFAIEVGANLPFDPTGLPYTPGSKFPPVVTPMPDFHYGYPYESFNGPQSQFLEVMQHPRLHAYAKPNSSTYWPFFAVEYKSQSRHGSRWVAENQNAATGSHCVNSIETLMDYTRTTEQRQTTDSVAFSCVIDSDDASLWVHWREYDDDPRFVSSEVGHYHFHRPEDIRKFHSSVKNIIDYGLNERLAMIKNALLNVLPQLPDWEAEDKAARVRLSSQVDSAQSSLGVDEDVGADVSSRGRRR